MTKRSDETDPILRGVSIGDRTVDFTVSEAAKELGVSEEFVVQRCCDRCDGMGEVYVHERVSDHAYLTKRVPCPACQSDAKESK